MKKLTFQIPSRVSITIRENNGDDESLLSDISKANDQSNQREYLAAIVELGPTGVKPLADEFKHWKTNDFYYTTFVQRVFNHGHEFNFSTKCRNEACGRDFKMDEDLRAWMVDSFTTEGNHFLFTKETPETPELKELEALAKKQSPKAYASQSEVAEFTISTGKEFRFKYITHSMENYLDSVTNRNINTGLLQRELETRVGTEWVKVLFFKDYSSREMAQIRGTVNHFDTQWQPIVNYNCPFCKQAHQDNLFFMPGFYYPEVII